MSHNLEANGQNMAGLKIDEISDARQLKEARKNNREMRKNIPKIVHILTKNDLLRTKFDKEFN